ncbi:MAG: hypothetical protein HY842_05125 [Bacteroidetes bacterium]|nr:hypothetical protein [Bacteroidota bacterium]
MKSNYIKLVAIHLLVLAFHILNAQPGNSYLNNIMVPSPEVASLGRYIDVPVSYYTGVPNVSIPIHTLSEGPLSLPISLSYHAGGVQVSEVPSWVGLGWSLQAGGMVSRTVQDKMDEDGSFGWYYHGDEIPLESNACAFYLHYGEGAFDSEPDIFSFSFPGGSGKFYFSNDAIPVPVLVPMQDLKIVPEFATGAPFNLKGFDIVAPDGTIYEFGDIGDGTPAIEITASDGGNYPDIPSAWFLKKIKSYDGKFTINFSYTDEYFMQKYAPTRTTSNQLPEYLSSHVKSKRLASITTSLETVTFVPSDTAREDLDPHPTYFNDAAKKPKRLKSISIATGSFGKRFDLVHDYWLDNSAWASTQGSMTENKRLRLLRIVEKSLDGTTFVNPPQSFEYFITSGSPNFLPKTFSRAIDHWGFYNGVDQNNASLPAPNMPYYDNICFHGGTCLNMNLIGGGGGSSDRASYEAPMKYGALKKVNYPNGGFTEFDMEANERYVGTSYTTDISLVTCNHGYPNGGPCAGITTVGTPNPVTFTAAELPTLKYKLGLRLASQCNCVAPNSPPLQVSMVVKVYNASNTLVFQSGQYQINCNDTSGILLNGNLQTFCNNLLLANTPYRFEVFVDHASAIFMAYKTGTVTVGNEEVGGLRVKQIRTHDGVTTSNDIIRNYEYLDSTFTTRSSGVLVLID